MVVTKEIGSYEVLFISGYSGGNQTGFVYLNEPSGAYIGYVGIIKAGAALPPNVMASNGVMNIYFSESYLGPLLETLRNEKPAYVKFNQELKWGSVGTGKEPIGEHELLR